MNEITLADFLAILKKCIVYVVIVAIFCAIGAFCFCKFIATPTYQAHISFISTNSGFASYDQDMETLTSKISGTDVAASLQLMSTYVDLLCSRELYALVKEDTGLDYSEGDIKEMVSVVPRSQESLFIDVTVTATNPEHAIMIADSIYKIGGEYMASQITYAYIKAVDDSGNKAYQNYPNTSLTTLAAAVLGGGIVYIIALIISLMDKTIKGEKDFRDNYDIPILGNIPNFRLAAREEKK